MSATTKDTPSIDEETKEAAPTKQKKGNLRSSLALPVSMLIGVAGYFIYTSIPALDSTHKLANKAVSIIQPALIFSMLFLTFCKIKFSDLHFTRWHPWLLALQTIIFSGCALVCIMLPDTHWKLVIESFMVCMICPTATAAAVVTTKLGGNAATLTTYTILINLATAILVPALVPLMHPDASIGFFNAFLIIILKVFPLLFCPFLLAMILRYINPHITEWFAQYKDLAFYLWTVALALAIAVTTKTIVHATCPMIYMLGIALASALACVIQFAAGRYLGKVYGEPISAAQSAGQKNTVFAIWMAYTFMSPLTSLAGGFYSIWHNIYNSWQLYKVRKQ